MSNTNIFGKVNTDTSAVRGEDRAGSTPVESGAYLAKAILSYVMPNKDPQSQTLMVRTEFEFTETGRRYTDTFCVAGRTGDTFFIDKQTGAKQNLPGFDNMTDLAAFGAGCALGDLVQEDKTIEVFDKEAGGKVNKTVTAFPEIGDNEVYLLIQRVRKNKQKLNEKTKKYEDTAETYEVSEIVRVCDTDGLTFNERAADKTEREFFDLWLKANEGKVYDRTNKNLAKANAASTQATEKKANIFGK